MSPQVISHLVVQVTACAVAIVPCLTGPAWADQNAQATQGSCAVNIQGNNNSVRCKSDALVPCSSVKYGNDRYHENMEALAKEVGLPDNYYSRYHEDAVKAICEGQESQLAGLIDAGYVKATEVAALKRVLVRDDRSALGKSYESSREKFSSLGLCESCADNVAQYYTRQPASQCGRLAKQALEGDPAAVRELQTFPEYCTWKY